MTLEVDGRAVRVTNLDKVMYPATGTTKGAVLAYYQAVAPTFVAHAHGRPVTRKRWVDGVGTADAPAEAFFQKHLDKSTPEWVHTGTIQHKPDAATYPLADDAATLVWLAQLGSLELHVPQWRFRDGVPQPPDRLVIDLDPGSGAGLAQCVEVAFLIKEILDGVGLASVPVTSGSKGIHLYAGLDGSMSSAEASDFAHQLAEALTAAHPALVVSDQNKARREGRVLLDWSQNNGKKTTVAPYSLRGRAHPTVAAPRTWAELDADLRQLEFDEVLDRLATIGDPLAVLLPHDPLPVLAPMLASPASLAELRDPDAWHYEVKWDGYRGLASVADGRVTWRSRTGLPFAYPELDELGTLLRGHAAIIDGEIVALDADGRSDLALLQNHGNAGGAPAHFMAFDLLHLDGRSLLERPYTERRAALEALVPEGRHVHVPPGFGPDLAAALAANEERRLEGLLAKRPGSTYQPGRRSRSWLKIKNRHDVEVVVIGWTPGTGGRAHTFGSLVLAVPDGDGLRYVGKVGSGFTERALADAVARLRPLARDAAPAVVPRDVAREARWVEPTLRAEVAANDTTAQGHLRGPVWRRWLD